MNGSSVRTEHLPGGPDLERILREHAYRGAYLQLAVRGALVLFIALTLIFVPPMNDAGWCFAILGAYALWSAAVALWIRRGGTGPVTMIWLGLFVDLAVLATLTLLTGLAAEQSWTADILSNGLFVIPVLACTQLRTDVCVGVVACTIGVFFASSWATMTSNSEPWPSILLSTMALVGVGAGAVGLTRIQRSRVLTIGQLVGHRTSLLAELIGLEQRERMELSEQLHDGALQYVLAARMDLDELADSAEPVALARAGKALGEATTLLRSSVSELHPTVLVHVGLASAIGDLARSAQGRGGVVVDVDTSGWNDDLRTSADDVLFGTARELLSNVVKHAGAHNVRIELARLDHRAVLVVSDDGRGISADRIAERRAAGHIGLLSHELRVVAAGGSFSVGPGEESGTLARVEIPFQIATALPTATDPDR